jgi:diguanylate cyclase (GGDEF)-like protein
MLLIPSTIDLDVRRPPHPRRMGWWGATALAMGGSNQSLFLIAALFIGQDGIPGQGSAAIPLLIVGLFLSYAAAPGWTELVLMSPDRVGGIAAACSTAFRPYGPILSTLTGVCYWWGWIPTCGVTAILSATAISQWCLPTVPVWLIACTLVSAFTVVNLAGIRWVSLVALPVAFASAGLAFISMIAPLASGQVHLGEAVSFHLTTPFPGWFGSMTSIMAGLYLIGFGAPAFEAATCHVGEMIDPARNVPRAMIASAGMAAVYFAILPIVWLSALGPGAMAEDLGLVLGPTFAPVFGSLAKSAAIGFMMFNMFHGTMQPLAGAARTLSQLAEDGLAPSMLTWRSRTDAPWVATLLTAGVAILFLLIGDPIWLIAAANFSYLIGISLPSIAVWLLRRDAPDAVRPYRAPRGTVGLGLIAALVWGCSAVLGFQQFGLPTVVLGLLMAYSGAGIYALRMLENRARHRLADLGRSLYVKLTGSMLLVLALDAAGYILAVDAIPDAHGSFVVALEDIFVAVALLSISVGIVLPGMIGHSADQISQAARRLAFGTVHDLAAAMDALGEGQLEAAYVSVDIVPVVVTSRDELGAMAESFNMLQQSVRQAAVGLDRARQGLRSARVELLNTNAALANTVEEQERLTGEIFRAKEVAVYDASHDALTGLPNRAFLIERLNRMLTQQKDQGMSACAVLFIDLDGFKVVNDSLGHTAGDDLLFQVANRFRDLLLRRTGADGDQITEPSRNILGRLGGDEFTVLMSGIQSADDALAVAARIKDALVAPFTIANQDVHTSASIGIATSHGYDSAANILRDADLAMYRAKSLGKGRAEVYDPSLLTSATTRLHLENDLRRALRDQEFVLHYQPIVTLPTEEIAGFEALVRWNVPGKGLVYPNDFIAVAEETGIIVPLGLWVLREACITARAWNRRFGRGRKLGMSVNLSPRQFAQRDLVRDVEAILTETGVDPAMIKLEITESGTMGDPERAARVLSKLKSFGVQLSIDDFGTGYSSLSHLHKFPLDILKIDRSFVAGLCDNRESRQIVKTIMGLARGMGMQVVAEGIERREQVIQLCQMGCQFGQGYLFSKPLPESEIVSLLNALPQATGLLHVRIDTHPSAGPTSLSEVYVS